MDHGYHAVLNIDEVGGSNAASAAYTDTLVALTRAYSPLETQIASATVAAALHFAGGNLN